MSAGLQVFDSSGKLVLDSSSYIGRFISIINASASRGSASVPGIVGKEPFWSCIVYSRNQSGTNSVISSIQTAPYVTFSGSTVSWTRSSPPKGFVLNTAYIIVGIK